MNSASYRNSTLRHCETLLKRFLGVPLSPMWWPFGSWYRSSIYPDFGSTRNEISCRFKFTEIDFNLRVSYTYTRIWSFPEYKWIFSTQNQPNTCLCWSEASPCWQKTVFERGSELCCDWNEMHEHHRRRLLHIWFHKACWIYLHCRHHKGCLRGKYTWPWHLHSERNKSGANNIQSPKYDGWIEI